MIENTKNKIIEWSKKNARWIIAFICFATVIIILDNIFENDIHKFDDLIYSKISKFISEPITNFFKVITNLRWSNYSNFNMFYYIYSNKK